MDRSEVIAIVEQRLELYRDALNLHQWTITVTYGRCETEGSGATVDLSKADYRMALINIDPDQHDTPEQVRESLLHELLHIVLEPLNNYRLNMRHQLAVALGSDLSEELDGFEHHLWRRGVERAIHNLEGGLHHSFSAIEHLEARLSSPEQSTETVDSPQEEEHVEA